MKTILSLLFPAIALPAFAEIPKQVPSTRYSILITNSPFTSKPVSEPNAPEVNPLDDYALGGVSPIPGGYRVTLLNKKNPEERIFIPEDKNFKLLAVHYAPGNPLGTTVRVSTGSKTGTVSVDEKLLTLKAAPAPQPVQQQAPQQPQVPGVIPQQPPVPQTNGEAPRQPRPRVVPPPAGANNGGAGNVAPQPVQQQQQGQRINTQQRPNRR